MAAIDDGKKPEIVYRMAILGRGASAAYYIENAGVSKGEKDTILIGEEQPWRTERGREGVINHPHPMIDPQHAGGSTLEQALSNKGQNLAKRDEFSNRIDAVIGRIPTQVTAKITSVTKIGGPRTKVYRIVAGGARYYAQNVVAALGIGKHAEPDEVENLEGATQVKGLPRVMDMDTFQRGVAEGTLRPADVPKGVVVVGPNAAIDVLSTALRSKFRPITWLTGKRPFFLPGTDNEFVEQTFDNQQKRQENGVTVVRHDYLSSKIGADGVEVTYGQRAMPAVEEHQAGTQEGSIMVYGLGPNAAEVAKIFTDVKRADDLEGVYDTDQRFNSDPSYASTVKLAIQHAVGEQRAQGTIRAVESVLGGLPDLARPSDGKGRVKDPVARKLPSVVGLKAKKANAEDETSLEFVGAAAYRLAANKQVEHRYLSGVLGTFKADHLDALEQHLGARLTGKSDFDGLVQRAWQAL